MYQATIYHDFAEFITAADFPTVYRKTASAIRFLERRMQMPKVNAVIRDGMGRVVAIYAKNPDAVPFIMWGECSAVPAVYSSYWYEPIDDNSGGAYYVEKGRDWVRVEWCEPEPEEPEEPEDEEPEDEEPEEPEECRTYADEIERIFCMINRVNW